MVHSIGKHGDQITRQYFVFICGLFPSIGQLGAAENKKIKLGKYKNPGFEGSIDHDLTFLGYLYILLKLLKFTFQYK